MAAASDSSALRITVLAGGPSAERDVSLASGQAVAAALTRLGHQVHLADISTADTGALDVPADVVFPALHGSFGEDGQLQRLLEEHGLPYVGCNAATSQVTIDKLATKEVAQRIGVPTPAWRLVERGAAESAALLPCVVKPVADGSSVGVTICGTVAERGVALAGVLAAHETALLEAFVPGVEVTVGVLDGEVLPPIRIRPRAGFYDYKAKYQSGDTAYEFDTGLAGEVLAALAGDTLRLFRELACRHLARADWIVDAAGRHWFLEINTLPGFTAHSLLPKAAARHGIPFDELCGRLVAMALRDAT